MTPPKTKKLFISYRSNDAAKVDKIARDLALLKYDDGIPRYITWQDKHNLPPASPNWWDAIVDAIIDCDMFVFHLSRESLQSAVCMAELEYAHRCNRPIIPVVLEGEFDLKPIAGKYDLPPQTWAFVPDWLHDVQLLFYNGASFFTQFQEAVELFERNWPRDIPAPRPMHPDGKSAHGNNHARYSAACDYAGHLAFADAENHFIPLLRDSTYVDFAELWLKIIRSYAELIEILEKRSPAKVFNKRWNEYLALFPNDAVEGVFDPKNFAERDRIAAEKAEADRIATEEVDATVAPESQTEQSPSRVPIVWVGAIVLLVVVLVGVMLANGVIGGNGSMTPALDATPVTQAALQPTDLPTESATPDIEEAARQLLAQQTAARAIQTNTPQSLIPTVTKTSILSSDILTATSRALSQDGGVTIAQTQRAVKLASETTVAQLATETTTAQLAAETATAQATIPLTTVTHNIDWTPVERNFDGVTMVLVPSGCFEMGNDPLGSYRPGIINIIQTGVPKAGRQCFDKPFWIDKDKVSIKQYSTILELPSCVTDISNENKPVTCASWFEASNYCQYRNARLPTEREWEYTARGPDSLFYPWGNDTVGNPIDVSWVGALNMSGNGSEWTNTAYTAYPYNEFGSRSDYRAKRGYVRSASRDMAGVYQQSAGLRCVVEFK